MPRAQRIPEPKPLTKWEKFAAEKGIKKTKRERMVFDESRQEYAPRYGYKRVNGGIEDQPIVEIKAGQDPFLDPWENARVEKKQRVARNLKNQAKNQERAEGKGKSKGKIEDPLSFGKIKVEGVP
jgi:regulator of ribosome biosynthesis